MRDVKIRNASSLDLDEIVKMRLSLQKHAEKANPLIWRYTDERKRLIRQELEEHFKDENNLILIAEAKGEIVGLIHGAAQHRTDYIPNDIGNILTIYVHENFRRRGIGSRLVQEVCRFFRSRNVQEVYLRYVLGNKEAEKFWARLGFKPILVTANTQIDTIEERLKKTG